MKKEIKIRNNQDLLNHFSLYQWAETGTRSRWMIVLTVRGTEYRFYSNSSETAKDCLNELAATVSRRFCNRLFMESKGDLYSLEFHRIARGSLGEKVLYTVA